jgi:hypothetical protein
MVSSSERSRTPGSHPGNRVKTARQQFARPEAWMANATKLRWARPNLQSKLWVGRFRIEPL